jgi:glycosyltransferase involved in cell wall biosynthesis
MKILHINTYSTSGACIAASRFHLQLLEMGIESTMLFLHLRGYDLPNVIEYHKSEELPDTYLIRQKLRFRNLFFAKKPTQIELNEQKLKHQPKGLEKFSFATADVDITTQKAYKEADIIHFHWTGSFLDFSFFQKNTKPVVWTIHDMNPFTGGCHYSNGCSKYKTQCIDCPQLQGTIDANNAYIDQKYKQKMLGTNKSYIISPSKWLLDCSIESSVFNGLQCKQIFNCVDFSIFSPQDKTFSRTVFSIPNDKKILLFVSDSLENSRKGFDILVDAIKICNNKDIHLCAIGKRPKTETFDTNITYLDTIKDERLLAIAYSAADVFVLPSREDNLPNVMLESLACGVPVIALPIGGMLDVIKSGFNGILSDDISPESLSKAIKQFISDTDKFNSVAIRDDAKQKFSPQMQAAKYVEVYKSLLQ